MVWSWCLWNNVADYIIFKPYLKFFNINSSSLPPDLFLAVWKSTWTSMQWMMRLYGGSFRFTRFFHMLLFANKSPITLPTGKVIYAACLFHVLFWGRLQSPYHFTQMGCFCFTLFSVFSVEWTLQFITSFISVSIALCRFLLLLIFHYCHLSQA